MSILLRTLFVDDSDDDVQLILRHLITGGYEPRWERVDTSAAMSGALDREQWDVILCDYKMPFFTSHSALKLMQEKDLDIPFIIVSGAIGEETAVAEMKSGVHDFIMKDNPIRLVVAIEREIREAKVRKAKKKANEMLQKSEENFHHSLDDSPLGIRIINSSGETIYANQEILNIYGYDNLEELKTVSHKNNYTPECYAEHVIRKDKRIRGENTPSNYGISIIRKDGKIRHLEVFRKEVLWNGELQSQALYLNVTKRKRTEEKLRVYQIELEMQNDELRSGREKLDAALVRYYDLYDLAPGGYCTVSKKGVILEANITATTLLGVGKSKLTKQLLSRFILKEDQYIYSLYNKKLFTSPSTSSQQAGESHVCELRMVKKEGSTFWARLEGTVTEDPSTGSKQKGGETTCRIMLIDITERKQAEEKLRHTLENLRNAINTTINVMASTLETRDPYTAGHQNRVADLARAIATDMGLPQEKIDGIRMAGTIHDIGKLSIPAEILSKPTKLSELEFSLIKEHSRIGYEILKDVESPWPLAQIVYQHHERMDGSGYPRKLKGDEILIEARIMAVADVVEAMASHRPYRAGLGIEAALHEIEKNRGIFYGETVVDTCLQLFRGKGYQLAEGLSSY